MISYLSGTILNKGKGFAVIRVGDVGYKVYINPTMLAELGVGQTIEVYTHQYVREDALDLFGFRNMDELEMFELLLSISGVGPKSALGVLSISDVGQIKDSILRGDPNLLTKVSGIGRKTAERIVLELREKVGQLSLASSGAPQGGYGNLRADEIDALIALGYTLQNARDALRQVDANIMDSGERIREALKRLAK
jgi:holliday junction DNA helicase RuvA